MDASDNLTRDWQDLDITREDLNIISESLKNEQFRQLLTEYANEVNDPENKKLYEKEFTELERQRGIDVTFVKPRPGYVIKTSTNGDKKCFLNVSQSELVAKPTSEPSYEEGNRGLKWSIPYTLTPPRDDLDRKNVHCVVVDVVFHPDTLHLASKNAQFRDIVNNTAVDGVETHYKMKLDRKNLKFPKMAYKGTYQPTVIRKPCEKAQTSDPDTEIDPEIYQKLMSKYDESRERQAKMYSEKEQRPSPNTKYFTNQNLKVMDEEEEYSKPKYTIKYQSDVDLGDYTIDKDAKLLATVPKKLLITIDLPLLRTANDATLDVQERSLSLKSDKPAKYYLKLSLPYRVDANNGNAKFDVKRRKLNVTLPVIRSLICPEDSGVDSDNGSPIHETMDDLKSRMDSVTISSDDGGYHNNSIMVMDEDTARNSTDSDEVEGFVTKGFKYQDPNSIMDPDVKYNLPVFFCNVFENILAVTINVKNVESGSICHRVMKDNSGFHLVFKSIGAGFFPSYYSFCMKIRPGIVDRESLSVEPWDNNVVLTVTLSDTENLTQYYVGMDENSMETKCFSNIEGVKKKIDDEEEDEENSRSIEESKDEDSLMINTISRPTDSEDEDAQEVLSRQQERKRTLIKSRSISESSCDELPSNPCRQKGILKFRREFSRSVSESSIDDGIVNLPSIHFSYDSAQEINSESECANLKKTVRFNEVVSRQVFRSNSSILGRRKKNQRKMRNKKRAFERRMSESENSETEERDKYKIQPKFEITGVL